jgi:hypothetical protein
MRAAIRLGRICGERPRCRRAYSSPAMNYRGMTFFTRACLGASVRRRLVHARGISSFEYGCCYVTIATPLIREHANAVGRMAIEVGVLSWRCGIGLRTKLKLRDGV